MVSIQDKLQLGDVAYTGYVWYSDAEKPEMFQKERVTIDDSGKRFVVEAQLCSDAESVSVRFADGKYVVVTVGLNSLGADVTDEYYVPHRMPGVEKLHFKRVWREENDPQESFCLGMATLQPAELVFVGFKMKEG